MITDPIADYLTRLRNAVMANHRVVEIPASNLKKDVTKLLYDKAEEPKKIIWYPTKHRKVPQNVVFPEAIRWFNEHL